MPDGERKVTFDSQGAKLVGILAEPPCAGAPMVVMCHGLGATKDAKRYCWLEDRLMQAGIGTLRFDFIGHGESDQISFSNGAGVANLASAVDFLVKQGHSITKTGVIGSSVGGQVALEYATKHQDLGALVLRGADGSSYQARMVKTPTMIVIGSKDEEVSVGQAKQFLGEIPAKTGLYVIRGGSHKLDNTPHVMEFVGAAADWFIQTLRPSDGVPVAQKRQNTIRAIFSH